MHDSPALVCRLFPRFFSRRLFVPSFPCSLGPFFSVSHRRHGFPQAGCPGFGAPGVDILFPVANREVSPALAFALQGGMCYSCKVVDEQWMPPGGRVACPSGEVGSWFVGSDVMPLCIVEPL